MFNRRRFVGALVAVGSVGVPSLSFAAQETSREKLVRLCEEAGYSVEFDDHWSADWTRLVIAVEVLDELLGCGICKFSSIARDEILGRYREGFPCDIVNARVESMCSSMLASDIVGRLGRL